MAAEYRFIIRPDCYTIYRKGEVVKRNGKEYFQTYPLDYEKARRFPLSICKLEEELSDKERLDILVDWNGPIIDMETGEPTGIEQDYNSIEELTKALRYHQYDEGEI